MTVLLSPLLVSINEDSGKAVGWSIGNRMISSSNNGASSWFITTTKLKFAVYGKVLNPASGKPVITGTAQFGQVLGVDTSSISDGDGLVNATFSYQWVRVDGINEADISGAMGSTYTPVRADLGKKLKVEVSFTDDDGNDEGPLVSDSTTLVPVAGTLLVGNIGQQLGVDGRPVDDRNFVAQEFTTGNHSNGYNVSMVVVKIEEASSTRVPVVSIYSSNGERPATKLYDFNGSVTEAGDRNFTAPVVATLSPNTKYFVHIAGGSGSGSFRIRPGHGDAIGFDSSSLPGWSVSTSHVRSDDGGGSWYYRTGFNPRFSVWGVSRSSPLPDVNNPPVFMGGSNFSVYENTVSVGTVVASDDNSQDNVTGYSVSGGVDSGRFSITDDGVLSFKSAPNFERPGDDDGDNVHVFEVTVTSGTGDRVRTASQMFSVTVIDVAEVPSRPDAPVLSSPSSTSLLLSWSAPLNTGPSITDYDVGYGRSSNGPFGDWPHTDASRSTTIPDLNASTLYYVRVLARNAEGASGWSEVSNFTTRSASPPPVTNGPPVFTSNAAFSVNENSRNVGTVVASDSDSQDSVTGYTISGGVDRSLFSITSGGVLSFVSAPNYENPSDTGTNNGYVVVVEATSGAGGRELSATQSITVTVVDVVEPSSRPDAPVLSSPSSTSLLLSWSAPLNTGPSITDYDVGYGRSSNGPFGDWPHTDASRSTTIPDLNASTLYYVRVLARNAEGASGWSEVSNFTTRSASPPPVTNGPPVFTSNAAFSVNENSRNVGTVVASDSDSQDSVTGYTISGGVDRSLFSITSGGVLSFRSAPDYEHPGDSGGDNVYVFVVEVTSGTGSRVLTATQTITVTVNDVDETGPVAPHREVVLVYNCG